MLPGKKYAPEDVLQILRRRVWFVLVPFSVIAAATAVVVRKLPDRYTSKAVVLVVPQQVPADYVKPTTSTRLDEQLQTITQQLLSRTRLEQIIDELNLYPDERRTGIMQDVVEEMTKDVSVDITRGDAFSVSYTSGNARTAQAVASKLTSAFIDESTKDQQNLTEGTSQFLESSTEEMRLRLEETEKKLQAYRQSHSGELPTQLEGNLTALQNTHQQMQIVIEAENRDHDRHIFIERQIADLQAPPAAPGAPPLPPPTDSPPRGTTAQMLAFYEAQLQSEQAAGWKDERPEVRTTRRMIDDLHKKMDQEALAQPVSTEAGVSPAEVGREKKRADFQSQLAQLDKQIAYEQSEEKRLQAVAAGLQQRVDDVPARESELLDLNRDYTTLSALYNNRLAKKEEADLATNLQRRQIGETFKLLDAARVPERPASPNRPLLNVAGLAGGLGVGVLLVGLLEYRDKSFKSDDEIVNLLAVRVLAVVPFMESGADHRRAVRMQWLMNLGCGGMVAACLALVLYTFVR
jgi:polysaccharide chain length determinant protein (PEP-CTERM system associated)